MQYLLKELVFRTIYFLITIFLLYGIFYLTYGLQMEFFDSYFTAHYQSMDFNHFEKDLHSRISVNSSSHASRSWEGLNLQISQYFYNSKLESIIPVYSFLFHFCLIHFQTQLYGLINPAIHNFERIHYLKYLIYFNICFLMLVFNLFNLLFIFNEFSIEPIDSELQNFK